MISLCTLEVEDVELKLLVSLSFMLYVSRSKRHVNRVVEHATFMLITIHDFMLDAKDFVEQRALHNAWGADTDKVAIDIPCVFHECFIEVHDSSCASNYSLCIVVLIMVVLDDHQRIERILQIFAHHHFLHLWAALQNKVEERFGAHAVVELVLDFLRDAFDAKKSVISYCCEVSLTAETHVYLVTHHIVQMLVFCISEQVSLHITFCHVGGVLTKSTDFSRECQVALHRRILLPTL